jgi:ABC-type iron transport system FetAB permease component
MVVFLLLIILAMVLGLIGAVAHGLFFLLVIGIVLFVADIAYLGRLLRRSGRRPVR